MAALDTVSLTIMFAALLVLAGILSSLVALRFGAPLLLVFLLVGMLAGESGPGGVTFDDVRTTLSGRRGGARADSVRRRTAHAARDISQRAGNLPGAGDDRRPAHRRHHGTGCALAPGIRLGRVAAGRRRRRLNRCGGGVLAHSCPRPLVFSPRPRPPGT